MHIKQSTGTQRKLAKLVDKERANQTLLTELQHFISRQTNNQEGPVKLPTTKNSITRCYLKIHIFYTHRPKSKIQNTIHFEKSSLTRNFDLGKSIVSSIFRKSEYHLYNVRLMHEELVEEETIIRELDFEKFK